MNDAAIELRGIVKSYGKKDVLTGLDLAVPLGSVLGLLGTNGAGKTTLIKCVLGLMRPQQGEARLLGESSWTLSAAAKARIALLQFWVFGVGAWFVRCRSLGVQLAGFALAVYVPMIPGALCAATGPLSPWRYMALPLAGIAALSGLLLTCDAYRRWLAADLG